MQIGQLSEHFFISGQIEPEHVPQLAEHGFKTIICNRADGEDAGQPSAGEIAAAAAEHGIEFVHIPVVPPGVSHRCHIRANIEGLVTGDRVAWCEGEPMGVVVAQLQRDSELRRPDARGNRRLHQAAPCMPLVRPTRFDIWTHCTRCRSHTRSRRWFRPGKGRPTFA